MAGSVGSTAHVIRHHVPGDKATSFLQFNGNLCLAKAITCCLTPCKSYYIQPCPLPDAAKYILQ